MSGLEASRLTVRFGGVIALNEVSITVAAGTVVGLIGPNGAGKTTMVDAVTGFVKASGDVVVNGTAVAGMVPHKRVANGLVRTFQSGGMFTELSLVENLTVVGNTRPDPGGRRARDLLSRLSLDDVAGVRPDDLSHGRQRLAGLARAMYQEPSVVLLDEPAAGLDSNETEALIDPIRAMADEGIGVLLIDHDVDFVSRTCSLAYALDFGSVVASGPVDEVLASAAVQEAYLGVPATAEAQ